MKLISIHNNHTELILAPMRYNIDVVGGWYVEKNGFSVTLTQLESGEVVIPKHALRPVQNIHLSRRSKRCFEFEIKKSGDYKVEFKKSKMLVVKRSNLFIALFLSNPIPNEGIEIYIYPKN